MIIVYLDGKNGPEAVNVPAGETVDDDGDSYLVSDDEMELIAQFSTESCFGWEYVKEPAQAVTE